MEAKQPDADDPVPEDLGRAHRGPAPEQSRRPDWQKIGAVVGVLVGITGLLTWAANVLNPLVNPAPPTPTINASVTEAATPVQQAPKQGTSPGDGAGSGWSRSVVGSHNGYVAVTAHMDPADSCNGGTGWVFPRSISELPALPLAAGDRTDGWARENGGVPRTENYIRLELQELNAQTIIVNSVGVRVLKRSAAHPSTAPLLSGGCGVVEQSYFDVDLDIGDNPTAKPASVRINDKTIAPMPLPHKLGPTDQTEAWNIRVKTTSCDCEFALYFDYTVAGQPHTYDVTLSGGKPWRISAVTGAKPAVREDSSGVWHEINPPG